MWIKTSVKASRQDLVVASLSSHGQIARSNSLVHVNIPVLSPGFLWKSSNAKVEAIGRVLNVDWRCKDGGGVSTLKVMNFHSPSRWCR